MQDLCRQLSQKALQCHPSRKGTHFLSGQQAPTLWEKALAYSEVGLYRCKSLQWYVTETPKIRTAQNQMNRRKPRICQLSKFTLRNSYLQLTVWKRRIKGTKSKTIRGIWSKESSRPELRSPHCQTSVRQEKHSWQISIHLTLGGCREWGGLLRWPRCLNCMCGLAFLPLNQGSVTGDKNKSWIRRCCVSTLQTVCIAAGNHLSHLDHFLIPIPFKPAYNLLGHSVQRKPHQKKDTRKVR